MPASDDTDLMARMAAWISGGAVAGAMIGLGQASVATTGSITSVAAVGKLSAGHAGKLASIAGVFSATDVILTKVRGPSGVNQAAAGCAAGGVLGMMTGGPGNAAFYCVMFGGIQGLGGLGLQNSGAGH